MELFTDEAFTVFSDGVHDNDSANLRFDRMLALADVVPFAKQPVIVRSTGVIIGYTGAGTFVLDGMNRLEWGWRLTPEARGQGYATEATSALLARADTCAGGELLCIVAVGNIASRRVADKVGFNWRTRIDWLGDPADPVDLLVRSVGRGGPPLLAPDPRGQGTHSL